MVPHPFYFLSSISCRLLSCWVVACCLFFYGVTHVYSLCPTPNGLFSYSVLSMVAVGAVQLDSILVLDKAINKILGSQRETHDT